MFMVYFKYIYFNTIQDIPFRGCSRMAEGKKPPS